jgi:DNA-binding transcriptional MerR regulator
MVDTANAFKPAEVCQQLGITESTLRRMAQFYEASFGPLPTGSRGREYPDEAVKRFITARQLVDEGQAATLERAFEALANLEKQGGTANDVLLQAVMPNPDRVMFGQMLEELQRLRELVERQEQRYQALQERYDSLDEKILKVLTPSSDTPSGDKAAYVAEMEQIHADYERRLRYLQGELERRDKASQPARRPWWRRLFKG